MNINQQGLNDNQVNDKNMFQIKIMKNSKNDNFQPRDIKRPKLMRISLEKWKMNK